MRRNTKKSQSKTKTQKKNNKKNDKVILLLFTVMIFLVIVVCIAIYCFGSVVQQEHTFSKITWKNPIVISAHGEDSLASEVEKIIKLYKQELDAAIMQDNAELVNKAFYNYLTKMGKLSETIGYPRQDPYTPENADYLTVIETKLWEKGWFISHASRTITIQSSEAWFGNPLFGKVLQIQDGEVDKIKFQVITIEKMISAFPENMSACSDNRRIIIEQEGIEEEALKYYSKFNAKIKKNYLIYVSITHELQHLLDFNNFSISIPQTILESRAAWRILSDKEIDRKFALWNLSGWPYSAKIAYSSAYKIVFSKMGIDEKTAYQIPVKKLRFLAGQALEESTIELKKIYKR